MFIVCPSCSGPYNVPAAQIAPLVQVACPHCEYRLILDFEAANDPALREPGHQFAQGYENAEAYFSVYSHVTKSPDVKPFAAPGISGAAVTQQPPVAEVKQPVAAQAQPAAATSSSGLGAMAPSSGRGAKTVIQTPSKKPVAIDPAGEALAPRPKQPSGPTVRAGHNTEAVPEPVATTIPPSTSAEAVPERKPPHTPPVSGAISSGPSTPEPTKAPDAAAESNSQLSAKPAQTDNKAPEPIKVETPEVKTPDKPVTPTETPSSKWIGIIIVLILIGVGIGLFVMYNKG